MSTPISRARRRTLGAAGTGSRCSVPATLPSCTGMVNDGAAFQREDNFPDFYLLALFDSYLTHHAANVGWNFNDSLVGLQFHDGLAFEDTCARRDHEAHQVSRVDVLAQFRKFELAWAGSWLRRRCPPFRPGRNLRSGFGWSYRYSLRLRWGDIWPLRDHGTRTVLHGEDNLPDAEFVAFFDAYFAHRTTDR